jgi:hypothetical protein
MVFSPMSPGKKYVIGSIARAHLLALQALAGVARVEPLDPFAAFVAGMSEPSWTRGD